MKRLPLPTPFFNEILAAVRIRNLVHALEKLHAQTRRHVERDVAVH